MRLNIIIAVVLSIPQSLWAGPVERAVVKVESGLCGRENLSFKGSGVAIEIGDRTFILTSDHVVFSAGTPFCHKIRQEDGPSMDASLVAHEWGMGLALLEVNSVDDVPTIGLESFVSVRDKNPGFTVATIGFPYHAAQRLVNHNAECVITTAGRHQLPELREAIEVLGHGEFGMSGGVVSANEAVIGIMSHQYVRMVPGKPSVITPFSRESTSLENQLVVIPATEAREWIEQVLAEGQGAEQLRPVYQLDAPSQALGVTKVSVMGMTFSKVHEVAGCASGATAVGGGDGVGIGGGDGVGIGGGTAADVDGCFALEVQFTGINDGPLPRTLGAAAWLTKLRAAIIHKKSATIPYAVKHGKKIAITSLNQFFGLLIDSKIKPVVLWKIDQPQDHVQVKFNRSTQEIAVGISQIEPILRGPSLINITPNERLAALILVEQLSHTVNVIRDGGWDFIDREDINKLEGDPAWDILFNIDNCFDLAVRMRSELHKLGETLNSVRL